MFCSDTRNFSKMGLYGTCLLSFLALLAYTDAVAVMSVDLGSEWMKIGVVSPGVPMEIVLNKESKRKTPVAVSFREGERLFGEDAVGMAVRFPKSTFFYLLDLVGKTTDNPAVQLYTKRFPHYDIEADPVRNTVLFRHDNETFSPEELLGMILNKAREYAQEFTGQPIKDVVVTVPPFFNQAERRAIRYAAELANLKVLQLLSTNAAVGLNYGMFRRKDFNATPQYILFYDMGAQSTEATVASYQLVKTKERGYVETNPQMTVLGVGYDRTLGGLEVQLRLRDHLAKAFNEGNKKFKGNVFENPRAMAKLFKEAGRVKNILSANSDHYAQIEGLIDDHDFRLKVTREELEKMCEDVFQRVTAPVDKALKAAAMSIDQIDQIILMGAGIRLPKVQEILNEHLQRELGKSLNMDEAAAMGAVYKAADLGQGFKVKKFVTKEAVVFPIQVDFEREVDNEDGTKSLKVAKRTLFGLANPFPQKKILTFNKFVKDFEFYVNYGELDHLTPEEVKVLGFLNLTRVEVSGVQDAIVKHMLGDGVESKGVKAHFSMDESGILTLTHVESVFEKSVLDEEKGQEESTFSKLGSTISKLFSGGEEPEKTEKVEEPEGQEIEDKDKDEQPSKEGTPTTETPPTTPPPKEEPPKKEEEPSAPKNDSDSEPPKSKLVLVREPLGKYEHRIDVAELTAEQTKEVQKRIERFNEFDRQKAQRETAKNALETFVLDVQDKIWSDEYERATTEEERSSIQATCSELSDWLYDEGENVDKATYDEKIGVLQKMYQPIAVRVVEHRDRPQLLATMDQMLNISQVFLAKALNMSEEEQYFTEVELKTLSKVINDTIAWKKTKVAEQAKVPLTEMPKLTTRSIAEKIDILDREVKYLVNKARTARPKKTEKPPEKVENNTEAKPEPEEQKEQDPTPPQSDALPEQEQLRTDQDKEEPDPHVEL